MSLTDSVTVALMYLRRNHAQEEIAERFGVSQPTISRAVKRFVVLIGEALKDFVPTAEDIAEDEQCLVDGILAPCWSWQAHPELWSGKHRTTGHNIQIAADLQGRIKWVGDPQPGSMHDPRALRESGFLDDEHPTAHIADKGYIGLGLICPNRELAPTEKAFNKQVNSIRAAIERAVAHLKTWRILDTDYRRPLDKFAETLTAIIGLDFYRKPPF